MKKDVEVSVRLNDGREVPLDMNIAEECGKPGGLNRVQEWKELERIARERKQVREDKAAMSAAFNEQLKNLDKREDDVLTKLDNPTQIPLFPEEPKE